MKLLPLDTFLDMGGKDLEPSDWLKVDQERINAFADATNDHQFIHVDPDAAAATPFGGTIAHGFLTLSLLPYFSLENGIAPEGMVMAINYGLNKLRFLEPVPAGSNVRARVHVRDVRRRGVSRILFTAEVTIEIEGKARPALIAEALTLFVLGKTDQGLS